ncbi:MAG: hypothetical protein FWD45_00155 [Coriobacteriia bacterium]|nr:hypothetical protein [Coriobacteriia bacterium]
MTRLEEIIDGINYGNKPWQVITQIALLAFLAVLPVIVYWMMGVTR